MKLQSGKTNKSRGDWSGLISICVCLIVAVNSANCVEAVRATKGPRPLKAKSAPASVEMGEPELPQRPTSPSGPASMTVAASPAVVDQNPAGVESQLAELENVAPESWAVCAKYEQLNDELERLTGNRRRPGEVFLEICKLLYQNYAAASRKLDQIYTEIEKSDGAIKFLEGIVRAGQELEEPAEFDSGFESELKELKQGPLAQLIKQLAGIVAPVQEAAAETAALAPVNDAITSAETKEHLAQLDKQIKDIVLNYEQSGVLSDVQQKEMRDMMNELGVTIQHDWHGNVLDSGLLTAVEGTYNAALKVLNSVRSESDSGE